MARRWLGVELFKAIHTFVGSEYDIRVIFKFYHWQDDSYSQRSRKTNVELRYQYTQWRSENNFFLEIDFDIKTILQAWI